MKPRMLFRNNHHVIQTRARRNWPWILFALTVVLSLFAVGAIIDQAELRRERAVDDMAIAAFNAGRRQGQIDQLDSVRAAWQAAQAEADRCRRGP